MATREWGCEGVGSLHEAAEVVYRSVLQVHLKVKRPTNPSVARHASKVDRGDRIKGDKDSRLVDKDEPLVQRIEEARGGFARTGNGTQLIIPAANRIGNEHTHTRGGGGDQRFEAPWHCDSLVHHNPHDSAEDLKQPA